MFIFFFSSRRRHTRLTCDWSSDVCSSDLIAVDDSASEIAARASSKLGLAQNSPQAAEAARDKLLMRRLMSAGGAPSPVFRPFLLSDNAALVATQVTFPCVVKPLRLSGS